MMISCTRPLEAIRFLFKRRALKDIHAYTRQLPCTLGWATRANPSPLSGDTALNSSIRTAT
eukprot:8410506-Prorocentrum_lima.AAC.1